MQTIGRGGAGSAHSHQQQELIVDLLLDKGADIEVRDGRGKSPINAAPEAIRPILLRASD